MAHSNVSRVRGGHIVIGLALLVMGAAVLVIAFARQAERSHAAAELGPACVGSAEAVSTSPEHASGAYLSTIFPGSAPSTLDAAAPMDAEAPRDAANDSGDAEVDLAARHDFWFIQGTLALSKDERQRLWALGVAVARHPEVKVNIVGYGDTIPDADTSAFGRKRAKVAQYLLAKAGVAESRISTFGADVTNDPRFARAIHVTTSSPSVEVDP
jgi:outer membrane protein OmpA-like peptidoglycan-associated protein